MPLDSSRLTSRVRDLLRSQPVPAGARDDARPLDGRDLPPAAGRGFRYVPEETVAMADEAATGCAVIERQYEPGSPHGRYAVGDYREIVDRAMPTLAVLAGHDRTEGASRLARPGRLRWDDERRVEPARRASRAPTSGPLLFFDLETTGLSGGAGTVAFLVGCGYFDAGGFRTRQYFLSGYEAEHELLAGLTAFVEGFGGLVTFNGRTFDVPLIETRYLFHRLESPFGTMPHFDMLHAARRLWRRRGDVPDTGGPWGGGAADDAASCSLGALEEAVLGFRRIDDVPGMEIPSRYFHYLRSGDMGPLRAVLEHNRLDLVSLAALTATAMRLVEGGPDGTGTAHEALAVGGVFERAGRPDLAEACYARAAGLDGAPWGTTVPERALKGEALRRLAVQRRRSRRFDEAAEAWQALLEADARADTIQEARRALAIYHEHRSRDLEAARRLAERALADEADPDAAGDLQYRLARLERKLERSKGGRGR